MPKNIACKRLLQEKGFANVSKTLSLGGEFLSHTHTHTNSFFPARKLHPILFIIRQDIRTRTMHATPTETHNVLEERCADNSEEGVLDLVSE